MTTEKRKRGEDRKQGQRNGNQDSASERRGSVVGVLSLEHERPLDWSDPTTLPWQQDGRALLLFLAA